MFKNVNKQYIKSHHHYNDLMFVNYVKSGSCTIENLTNAFSGLRECYLMSAHLQILYITQLYIVFVEVGIVWHNISIRMTIILMISNNYAKNVIINRFNWLLSVCAAHVMGNARKLWNK